jgi:hypothetical protein
MGLLLRFMVFGPNFLGYCVIQHHVTRFLDFRFLNIIICVKNIVIFIIIKSINMKNIIIFITINNINIKNIIIFNKNNNIFIIINIIYKKINIFFKKILSILKNNFRFDLNVKIKNYYCYYYH